MNAELSLPQKIEVLGGRVRNRGDLFRKAALAAGISYSQAKKIFYGETTDPKTSVRDRIEYALQKLNKEAEAHARGKLEQTADVGQLVARAVEMDADLRREVIALVLRKFAGAGPEDCAVGRPDEPTLMD